MTEIHEKLVAIQTKLVAPKNQRNNFGKYNYRSCEDILEAVKPLLKDQGCTLVITDEMVMLGDRFYVKAEAVLSDGKNATSATAYAREAKEQKGMADSQLTGATSSYARKYALNGLFLIDDNKDADTHDNREQMSPEPVDKEKVRTAIAFFRDIIDQDQIEENYKKVRTAYDRLTNDERIKLNDGLMDKSPGSKRIYKTLLKDYLDYVPTESEGTGHIGE